MVSFTEVAILNIGHFISCPNFLSRLPLWFPAAYLRAQEAPPQETHRHGGHHSCPIQLRPMLPDLLKEREHSPVEGGDNGEAGTVDGHDQSWTRERYVRAVGI